MLAPKRTGLFRSWGQNNTDEQNEAKGSGHVFRRQPMGPRGDAHAWGRSWGLGFAGAGEDLGIITLTGVDTKFVSRSSQIQEKR